MRINTINNAFLVVRSIGETPSSARNPYSGHGASVAKKLSRAPPILTSTNQICFKHVHAIFNLSSRGFSASHPLENCTIFRGNRVSFPTRKLDERRRFPERSFENSVFFFAFRKKILISKRWMISLLAFRCTNIREFHDICRIKGAVLSPSRILGASLPLDVCAPLKRSGFHQVVVFHLSPSPSFGILNPNTTAQPRLFHSRDLLPFRVAFAYAPSLRGKKASRCLRRTLTPP